MISCLYCDTMFTQKPGTSGKFCSLKCTSVYNACFISLRACKLYYENPLHCIECNNEIDYFKRKNCTKYCSRTCSAKATQTGKKRNKYNVKIKIHYLYPRKPYCGICQYCDTSFRSISKVKYCSVECRENDVSERMRTHALKYNFQSHRNPHKQSYMESSFEEWLIQHGISNSRQGYLTEVCFKNKATGKVGRIDFLFPRLKVVIELDGKQHKDRIYEDGIRDAYLASLGYLVVRITHTEYTKKTKINYIKEILGILI